MNKEDGSGYRFCKEGPFCVNEACICSDSNTTRCLGCEDPFTYLFVNPGLTYEHSDCITECPVTNLYYDSALFECLSCETGCLECFDGDLDSCTVCDEGFNFVEPSTCSPILCQNGFYLDSSVSPFGCFPCDQSCATCSGPADTDCLSCPENYILSIEGLC